MKIKFNQFERVAGVFVLSAIVGSFLIMGVAALKQGWFAQRNYYHTSIEQAEGIFPGTKVQMAGLRIGRVEKVEFKDSQNIVVHFSVLTKYQDQIRADSQVKVVRPFIIGEKVLDIKLGSKEQPVLASGQNIAFHKSFDLIDSLSGYELGAYFENLSSLAENLKFIAEAFLNKDRTKAMVEMFDELKPLIENANKATVQLNKMAGQMTKDDNLKQLMGNLVYATNEMNGSIQEIAKFSKDLPKLGGDTAEVMSHLKELTFHLNSLIPTIQAVAPELPQASKQALQALTEAVIVLKAMQKSFVLSGSVKEIKEEEAKKLKEADARAPAKEKDND